MYTLSIFRNRDDELSNRDEASFESYINDRTCISPQEKDGLCCLLGKCSTQSTHYVDECSLHIWIFLCENVAVIYVLHVNDMKSNIYYCSHNASFYVHIIAESLNFITQLLKDTYTIMALQ